MDKINLEALKNYFINKYKCHSIILYGSFSSGDFTEESDIDLLCFSDSIEVNNDTSIFEGRRLDSWINITEDMEKPFDFLHIREGIILLDERNLCTSFMENINDIYNKGPQKLSEEEKDFMKNWLKKMLDRSKKGDIEGDFRYHWMLNDSLEIYFNIKDKWYLGPKKSLKWLYENEKSASPNGVYTAYAYSFEGGATTSFNKIVSIIETSENDKEDILISKDPNVYFNTKTLNEDIEIKWEDDITLIVKVNEENENQAYIKMKADIVKGIKIIYE